MSLSKVSFRGKILHGDSANEKFRLRAKLLLQLNEAWEVHLGRRASPNDDTAFAGSHFN
jgi:hypothetical protein